MRLNMVKWTLWKTRGEKRMTGNRWENFRFLFTVCIKASKTVGGERKSCQSYLLTMDLHDFSFFFIERVYASFQKNDTFYSKRYCVTKPQNSKNEDSVSVSSRSGADKQAYRVLVMLKKKLLIDLARMRSHLFI